MQHTVSFKRKSYAVIALSVICLTALFAFISVSYENKIHKRYLLDKQKEFIFLADSFKDASSLLASPFEYVCYEKQSDGSIKIYSNGSFFDGFEPDTYKNNQITAEVYKDSSYYTIFGPIEKNGNRFYFAENTTDFKRQNIQTIYFSIFGAFVLMLAAGVAIRMGYSALFLRINKLGARLAKELESAKYGERASASLLDEYKAAVDASNIVSKTDAKGVIIYVNEAFCEVSGYSSEELLGRPQSIVRHPNMPKAVFKEMWETILDKRVYKGVIENRKKDGSSYFVDATIVPILNLEGEIIEFLGIRHDITEFINNKQKLFTSALTGLPNRYKLSFDLLATEDGYLAVINIDSFKIINDFYGNNIGDLILIEFAKRLSKIFITKGFVVYKLSSDEYGIFCEKCASDFEEEIVSGIALACADSIKCGDIEIVLGVSIGIASGRDGLLEKANMALGFAKKNRKQLAVYNESMLIGKNYEKNLTVSRTLREAIEGDWFVPYFQPIVNAVTGEIEKYETLVRIVKPDGEVLSPFVFLDVAKATRLYPHITRAVISKAFEIFKNKKESFSVNLSVEDILDNETRAFIMGMLGSYGIADRVVFEILESEGIENYEEVSEFVCAAKKLGVQIAIDDFGTGYSNFEHLAKLNVDIIKIDGSLIKNIDTNKNSEIITQTIVSFATKLGMKSVAEFVHSKEVYDKIKEIGVDYAQGYHLGQPAPMSL